MQLFLSNKTVFSSWRIFLHTHVCVCHGKDRLWWQEEASSVTSCNFQLIA